VAFFDIDNWLPPLSSEGRFLFQPVVDICAYASTSIVESNGPLPIQLSKDGIARHGVVWFTTQPHH
jgi:hypothetical protein